LLIKEQTTKSE